MKSWERSFVCPECRGREASTSRGLQCPQRTFAAHRSLSSMRHHLVVRSGRCPQCSDEDTGAQILGLGQGHDATK